MADVKGNNKIDEKGMKKVEFESKYRLSNVMIGLIVAIALIIFNYWIFASLGLDINQFLFVTLVSLLMYIFLLYILMKTNYRRVVRVRGRNKDDVIKALVDEIEGKEKEQKEKKALDMIKPLFVGSSDTKVYHDINCSVAKKIKSKFRLENNSEAFFKSKKFKAHNCVKKK